MRRTIMYYPSIAIPDGNWLRKSLLYWDEVSSIVPRTVEYDLYSSNHLIAELKNEGHYRPIYPDQIMNSEYFNDFEKECIDKIKNYRKKFDNPNYRANFRPDPIQLHTEKLINKYDIHRDKMSYRIMQLLKREELISSSDDWMSFDNELATLYMSVLAKYSALNDVNFTVIGTDKIAAINSIYPVKRLSKKPWSYKSPVVNLSLNILPTPCDDVSYKKIMNFKMKYRDELLAFRNIINEFENQISNCETEFEMKEKSINFKEMIERGTREAMSMLKGSGINFFLSSLRSIINLKSPTMIATYTGIVGQRISDLHPAVSLAGIGIAGAVDISVNYMTISKSTKDKLAGKGFLYLYNARRKGIINDFI
ncbi:DUF6236 family protein [Paenibacillus sp. FSL W7-1279]|uniref:DUF6236 family protein n=1 Tax=unclassified Paenibacillus TaxID=185978 RepID=UPI00188BF95E|nr:DUF6236 family protein [Paenibacillus sp. JZ16]